MYNLQNCILRDDQYQGLIKFTFKKDIAFSDVCLHSVLDNGFPKVGNMTIRLKVIMCNHRYLMMGRALCWYQFQRAKTNLTNLSHSGIDEITLNL